jgi:carboxypeptidase C (cathepsin A)
MKMHAQHIRNTVLMMLLSGVTLNSMAQQRGNTAASRPAATVPAAPSKVTPQALPLPLGPKGDVLSNSPNIPAPVITKHNITINGQSLSYTATTGYLQLKTEDGKPTANIFFVAYTKDGVTDRAKRPITYTFNGGPGSSSVWLHMGVIGPKRVLMSDEGAVLPPPYQYVDNEYSWLDKTDMVFLDPVTTGYSRAVTGENDKQFHGYEEDIASMGDAIRLYSTQYDRWHSPKFLAGESYGTTRAAGLSDYLQSKYKFYLNGVVLISSILNMQTARFDIGNDLPFSLFLPTYAATAWYHKKLEPALQSDLRKTLKEVEDFALGEYHTALMKGSDLSAAEYTNITNKLSRYTGLSADYIRQTNLRIDIHKFNKELRRADGVTVGRLDSRFTGRDYNDVGVRSEFDPSNDGTISGPYSAAINHYVRAELKFNNELPYEILGGRVQPWNYNNVQNKYLNVAESLRKAMSVNPYLKVWVLCGYYDLATPYFAAEYTFSTMGLRPEQRKNVNFTYYEAGHMLYVHKPSLMQTKKDADKLYDQVMKEINTAPVK